MTLILVIYEINIGVFIILYPTSTPHEEES